MPHLNPLPIIAAWLEQFPARTSGQARAGVMRWLAHKFPNADQNLAADCLAAVGIIREQEQDGTVYCRASHE